MRCTRIPAAVRVVRKCFAAPAVPQHWLYVRSGRQPPALPVLTIELPEFLIDALTPTRRDLMALF